MSTKTGTKTGKPRGRPRIRDPICTIEGCDRPHRARGFCDTHYGQWYAENRDSKWVKIQHRSRPHATLIERIETLTGVVGDHWVWTGTMAQGVIPRMYSGKFNAQGHPMSVNARNEIWTEILGREIPPEHTVRANGSCPKGCVKPSHLYCSPIYGWDDDNPPDDSWLAYEHLLLMASVSGSLTRAGKIVGLTRERVRQIRNNWRAKLEVPALERRAWAHLDGDTIEDDSTTEVTE